MNERKFTCGGLDVTPVMTTLVARPGGMVVDIKIHDKRSTTTYATVAARTVVDQNGVPLAYY